MPKSPVIPVTITRITLVSCANLLSLLFKIALFHYYCDNFLFTVPLQNLHSSLSGLHLPDSISAAQYVPLWHELVDRGDGVLIFLLLEIFTPYDCVPQCFVLSF